MKHRFGHHQKFFQKMVLTPQMRQSLKLLGMSAKDISELINSAVEANPFLQKILDGKKSNSSRSTVARTNIAEEYGEDIIKERRDPRASLLSQLRLLDLTDKELEIAEYLIYEMDDNGYITADTDEVAGDLSADAEEVENCIIAIQSMDPPGIGARDIRECLQLQLKRMNKEGSLEYRIVSEFIDEVAKSDKEKIARALKIDKEAVRVAVNNIKKLNPRPASNLLTEQAQWIAPDLTVIFKNKKIRLELNREWLPRLRLYNPYENKLGTIKDSDTREFIKENMESAKHLIDGIKRREETMCKVAEHILSFHKDSLKNGGHDLKSLMINDIAKTLRLHPSTVNRAISNKYVQIDDKVITLKSLLSSKIKKTNGESVSKISVKKRIEALVKNEDKSRPLSDNTIQEMLIKEGIMIHRRTIAKYRNLLNILPTYLRKNK
ncbi:MAG: RNA polymerase factor sigma-54 [Candidatus Omnitrophica bacterium]|nr:RNA polymerase factor sigma-54 [Candidatus Omnitrophota bacterium]